MPFEIDDADAQALLEALPNLIRNSQEPAQLTQIYSRLQQRQNSTPTAGSSASTFHGSSMTPVTAADSTQPIISVTIPFTFIFVPFVPFAFVSVTLAFFVNTLPSVSRFGGRGASWLHVRELRNPLINEVNAALHLATVSLASVRPGDAVAARQVIASLAQSLLLRVNGLGMKRGIIQLLSPLQQSSDLPSAGSTPLDSTSPPTNDPSAAEEGDPSKRTGTEAGFEESLRRSKRIAGAAGAASRDVEGGSAAIGEADDAGGGNNPGPRRAECPRGANRVRRRLLSEQPRKGKSPNTKRGKKPRGGWVRGAPPNATREGGLRIVSLGLVSLSLPLQRKLGDFLGGLPADPLPSSPDTASPTLPPIESSAKSSLPLTITSSGSSTSTAFSRGILPLASSPSSMVLSPPSTANLSSPMPPPPSLFVTAMKKCYALEVRSTVNDFALMLSYIEAAFYIQWRQKEGGKTPTPYRVLAAEVPDPSIDSVKIQQFYSAGTRLIYLAGSELHDDLVDVIEEIGYLLASPHAPDEKHRLSKDCGDIVRKFIVPEMVWIKQVSAHLRSSFSLSFPPNKEGVCETIPFCEIERMNKRLKQFDWSYWNLPQPDPCWKALVEPMLAPALPYVVDDLDLSESCMAEVVTVRTPLNLKATSCPVNPDNSKSWTALERQKAAKAVVVSDVSDLQKKLKVFHAGGIKTRDGYLCIPTEIMQGKTLLIRGAEEQLIALVITNIAKTLPHIADNATTIISAVMEGEVSEVDSAKDEDFEFSASHYGYWGRYAQQGDGAPQDVHPHLLRRPGVSRVNFTQRVPHPSQEMKDEPEENELIAEFIRLVVMIVEIHASALFALDLL
ncbi:hypothetical protein B0H16DRAFT_1747922 [Mycena metata]|uniref:Uncharacterized protein n=1 Tax=Mycena metata TaxID=1033252 RepID=A0AAD7E117_9AGAR|nr:hypothetical protein B0H16DRAFT_1747922 [Mycena metata]